MIMKRLVYYFIVISLAVLSCKKETVPAALPSVMTLKAGVDSLYSMGVPDLYSYPDGADGIPMAWSAYKSGLFSSEEAADFEKARTYAVRHCSEAVSAASRLISNLPVENLPEEYASLMGEARFFRALNNSYILRSSLTDNVADDQFLDTKDLIINDFYESVSVLPSGSMVENGDRITSDIARVALADFLLTLSGNPFNEDRYGEIVSVLSPVTESGKYRLEISTDAGSAFSMLRGNTSSSEYVYCVRASVPLSGYCLPKDAGTWGSKGIEVKYNAFKPSKSFRKLYGADDLRMKDREFFHTFYSVPNGSKTSFRVFEPAPYFWSDNKVNGIYRYSEVLLIMAEALANVGSPDALSYLMEVRNRSVRDTADYSGLTKNELLKQIWIERFRELPFEMKQSFDIVRTGFNPTEE